MTCDHVELARVLLEKGARLDTLDQDATDTATPAMRTLLERAAILRASHAAGSAADADPQEPRAVGEDAADEDDDAEEEDDDDDRKEPGDGNAEDVEDDASSATASMVDADDGLGNDRDAADGPDDSTAKD